MSADWMFDEAGVALELLGFARRAEEALADARAALERAGHDEPSDDDLAAVGRAFEAVLSVRYALREIDSRLLGDAQAMLAEVERRRPQPDPAVAPAPSAAAAAKA